MRVGSWGPFLLVIRCRLAATHELCWNLDNPATILSHSPVSLRADGKDLRSQKASVGWRAFELRSSVAPLTFDLILTHILQVQSCELYAFISGE